MPIMYFCHDEKTMEQPIYISAISSVSAVGSGSGSQYEAFQKKNSAIGHGNLDGTVSPIAAIPEDIKSEILSMEGKVPFSSVDPTVLYSIYTARKALQDSGWTDGNFGINIGSSRGATHLLERYHEEFITTGKSAVLSSPTTTLGNISSWVAQDLGSNGPAIAHSITCSSALHAMINAIAWIRSGMIDKFLVGGSEAPLTPFTLAQMQALKIYSKYTDGYPCKAGDSEKQYNSMVLGEGAVSMTLEKNKTEKALAEIIGLGYGTESLGHPASISDDAECFQKSMRMALDSIQPEEIDVIVTHTPGTIQGDKAELNAINSVFGNSKPAITNNKWLLGHTLGASGALSIELGIEMLLRNEYLASPFLNETEPIKVQTVMVNAVGFGGNAVSIILRSV